METEHRAPPPAQISKWFYRYGNRHRQPESFKASAYLFREA